LQLTARADGEKDSDPVLITVLPLNGKTSTPTVTGSVYDLYGYVSGQAEPGSLMKVTSSNGWTTTVTADTYSGYYYAYLGWDSLTAGEQLAITSDAIGKTVSDAVYVTVVATPKTSVPTVTGYVYANGGSLSGSTEPNTGVSISLKRADGSYVASTWTYSGSYSIQLSPYVTLTAGEQLQLTARADGEKESDPVLITILPTQ
jgi:hypothetical protein